MDGELTDWRTFKLLQDDLVPFNVDDSMDIAIKYQSSISWTLEVTSREDETTSNR